jgi:galactosylxylosylprotein 3-beta-galactosyltransferase
MTRRKFVKHRTNILMFLLVPAFFFLCIYFLPIWGCSPEEPILNSKLKHRLIVLIVSSPENLKRRDTIRKTWSVDDYGSTVKYFFAIGTLDILPEQKNTLQSEKEKFNDLLLLPTLQDSYNTLTKKVLYACQYIHEYYNFDFLLKCDDDSYVLMHKILRELDQWESKGTKKELYWGFFNGRAQVKRNGPWKETDWILCDYYLPYALGGGYILSYNIVKFIANNANVLK